MIKSFDDRFTSLARVAKDLNTVSDQVSDSLRAVEERLRALGLGVQVELRSPLLPIEDLGEIDLDTEGFIALQEMLDLPIGMTENDARVRSSTETYLAYAKVAGTWRLVARTYECQWICHSDDPRVDPDEQPQIRKLASERPLLDSPRDIRLAAAEQIDDLLTAIEQAAQERISRIHRSGTVGAAAGDTADKPAGDAPGRVGGRVKQRRVPSDRTAR